MRIYVSKKEPIETLEEEDIIPKIIDGIEIDIVEIGEVMALNETSPSNKKDLRHKNHHGQGKQNKQSGDKPESTAC